MHAPGYRNALAAGAAIAVTLAAATAGAQTWVDKRKTPALTEIIAIDATGEPAWLFGHEDLAGDGLDTFKQPEQSIDVRTAYVATDAKKFWVRVYVSDPSAVDDNVTVYVFIDSDKDIATGGPAKAVEIDPKFTADPTAGGYEHALGIRGSGTVANIWDWQAAMGKWVAVMPAPMPAQAAAETGKDTDPLLISDPVHGYVQATVDLGLVGLAQMCVGNVFVRSAEQAAAGDGDLDVGKVGSCAPADSNGDNIPDILIPVDGCTADDQCPGDGICADGKCVVAAPCLVDGDCLPAELCSPIGTCVPKPGPTCSVNTDCGDLACVDGTCVACTLGGDQCDSGHRCAPTGRCVVDSGSTSSTGAGVPLNPGDNVQGGALSCSASARQSLSGAASLLLAVAGLLAARRRRRRGRGSVIASALLAASLLSSRASAQDKNSIDVERFKPAVTHDGFVMLEGSGVRPTDDHWDLGLFLNYAVNPLIVASSTGNVANHIVGGRLGFDAMASLTVAGPFAIGLDVPFFLAQTGDASPSFAGLGDVRLVPKLRILDDRKTIGLGIVAELRVPTHVGDFAGGARNVVFWPKIVLDHRFGNGLRFGVNGGVSLREGTTYANVTAASEFTYGGALSYRFGGLAGKVELGAEVDGGVGLAAAQREEIPLEGLLFVKVNPTDEWEIGGGPSVGLIPGYGVPVVRGFLGVRFTPTSHDRDHDGVTDSEDKCPDIAEDRDGDADTDGCPEEDADDDHDGIPNKEDECPNAKETINGFQDDDGCPDTGDRRVIYEEGKVHVLDNVQFESGSAVIKPESYTLLDQVALTIKANPEIKHVRVEGHTDDTGDHEMNMKLSKLRAQAVRSYLINRGISPARLDAEGYGPDKPLVNGTDEAARAKNRRVEFVID